MWIKDGGIALLFNFSQEMKKNDMAQQVQGI